MADHEKMLQEGEAALERAAELLAKAQEFDPAEGGEDPDEDFAGLDHPEPTEDEVGEGGPDKDGDDDCPEGEEDCEKQDDDAPKGESEDGTVPVPGPTGDEEPMAKAADGFVDATPLLEAIDAKLAKLDALAERVRQLEAQNATLVKALVEQNAGLGVLVKAHQVLTDETPRRPKSKTVSVPTRKQVDSLREIFAKAAEVVDDPVRMAQVEHYYHSGDAEGMLSSLTAEERAKLELK